jgi:Ca2+-binding RTX toxin-like protein
MPLTYGGSTSGYINHANNYAQNSSSYTTIQGSSQVNDLLSGGAGIDFIIGLGGNDKLIGNGGLDWLEGSQGSDTFFFQVGMGYDTVKDFGSGGIDKISLAHALGQNASITSISSLTFVPDNGGTSILYDGNVWMHLQGYTGGLSAINFNWVT